MGSGEIIIGMPEDNGGQELAGSIQTFTNPAWQRERLQKFPPMFARSSQFEFVLEEDDPNGLVIDFNASHPFDANFSWQFMILIRTQELLNLIILRESYYTCLHRIIMFFLT